MNNNSTPKRVCMIAMAAYPADPRIRRQVDALDEEGYEVDILCRFISKEPSKEKFGNATAYRIMNAPQRENKFLYFFQSVLFLFVAFFRLIPLSIKRKYKIIQTHNLPDYLIFAGAFHKLFGAKLLLDIHDPSVDLFEEKWPGRKNKVLKFLITKAEKYSCKLADHLITVTNTCKEKLVERGNSPDKITLILNTANENLFLFNKEREFTEIKSGVKLLYHGTIAERFGLHNAIATMPYLLKEIPDSIFNIYGTYEMSYYHKLERLIKDLKLSDYVHLHGGIRREEIPDIINLHHVGVVPYLQTDYMNLALPTKAFEYIAMGLPVVSTRLKDLSESFDDESIMYADSSDPEQIAKAIVSVCFNPDDTKNRVHKAYYGLSQISGSVMKTRFISLYDKLFDNNINSG